MTREEQLQQFAEQYTKGLYLDRHNLIQMVKAGAEWADQHPNWISVEDELPKEKQKVLVYMPADERCDHEYICEALYNYAWHGWEDADEPIELEGITHWMPLPQPPRKEEINE